MNLIADLNGHWIVRALSGPVPSEIEGQAFDATVPGCVHTDLLEASAIPDPFDGDNESALEWIGETVWEYSRTFQIDDLTAFADLVCEGLDTLATVEINGHVVGHSQNQHRVHRWAVAPYLVSGLNSITVRFDSAVHHVRAADARYGPRPRSYSDSYNYIRKSASNFGWDWGIRAVTAGIWRDIRLERWDRVAMTRLTVVPTLEGAAGVVRVTAELSYADDVKETDLRVQVGDHIAEVRTDAGEPVVSFELRVPDVDVWWPVGYGDQPLYEAQVVISIDGVAHARTSRTVGFRSVSVATDADAHGREFCLVVNGRRIWTRGINWIPDDAFVTRVDADRYDARLSEALAAHVNLVRVWGGGIYEQEAFYEWCDRHGMLVWQDFLFACAAYPEEEPFWSEVRAEAEDAVDRLASHPSLALWNGNNENIWGFVDWGWAPRLGERSWGNGYYRKLLPEVVAQRDGTRPYSPGSPFSFDDYVHPNDPAHGTTHIWDVWNREDYTTYARYSPRFVSEFGFQGPPAWSTLTRVVHDSELDPYGDQMLVHQKASDGNGKLERGYRPHFGAPSNIRQWHWITQLNQAHAIEFGINRFRSLGPLNSGVILWQLNDNWPVISWSVVDYDGNRKPAWFALRRAFAPQAVVLSLGENGVEAVVVNDTDTELAATLRFRLISLQADREQVGDVITESVSIMVLPRTSHALDDRVLKGLVPDPDQVLVCDTDGLERAVLYGADVKHQRLDPAPLRLLWELEDGEATLVATAHCVVRDLHLAADVLKVGASVDTGLIQLLPGESHRFRVTGYLPPSISETPPADALWSANRVVSNGFGEPAP